MVFKPEFRRKELVVFDLDGTLAETKSEIDEEMDRLLADLLAAKKVAVIGGGKYSLFRAQLLRRLTCPKALLRNLFLFPTTATSFYRYDRGWKNVYVHELTVGERTTIKRAMREVLREVRYVPPEKTYGKLIEDRGTQVTFSALGQDVVKVLGKRGVRLKAEWKRKHGKLKRRIAELLAERLPGLEVHAAGYTSIDVTRRGIDKGYGIAQIERYLGIPKRNMVFVGDALFPGGNDYAAKRAGVACMSVLGPRETKAFIRRVLG
jgi:HAD superfamily hydrolase (TIGR01484 family)